ncbi:MAG: type II toxin-antitoxin system Y4mF family antitoxin [Verrucomicrobiia bacterium]
MKTSVKDIGQVVKSTRKRLGVTQKELALTSGTGLRFIIELEKGKATCQLGKVLTVLNTLGVQTKLIVPAIEDRKAGT